MTQYEIKYQSREMLGNDEWGTYYYDEWDSAIKDAWKMRKDSGLVVVQIYEINIITFKDERED